MVPFGLDFVKNQELINQQGLGLKIQSFPSGLNIEGDHMSPQERPAKGTVTLQRGHTFPIDKSDRDTSKAQIGCLIDSCSNQASQLTILLRKTEKSSYYKTRALFPM